MSKTEATVLALKLSTGEDILGFYGGESSDGASVMMYRPVKFVLESVIINGRIVSNYIPSFFFPYGENMTPILKSLIVNQEISNPFFHRFYEKVMGELVVYEENRQERITEIFDAQELRDIMRETDSLYVHNESKVLN